MDQRWAREHAAGIGQAIAYYRERGKLSAAQLAGRCAELGMASISRVVITKLENGRRETVTTAELAVLARALGVPPVLLLYPLLRSPEVEVLPGQHVDPYAAITWFAGRSQDPADPGEPFPRGLLQRAQMGENNPIYLWEEHARLDGLLSMKTRSDGQAFLFEEQQEAHVASLLRLRGTMRDLGLTPPRLHPATAALIGEEAGDGSR